MTRHVMDRNRVTPGTRMLFRYSALARRNVPHHSSKALQKRATLRGNAATRRLAYLRIKAGHVI